MNPIPRLLSVLLLLLAAAPLHASAGGARELLIIDAGVADVDALAGAARDGVEVVRLSPERDALGQVVGILAGHEKVRAVHLVSHAEPGVLVLGGRGVRGARFYAEVSGAVGRGSIQYATSIAGPWTTLTVPNGTGEFRLRGVD